MKNNKGFTLIELMVVILIVAILAAVLAPMMTGRIRQAKWAEGKAGAGTLATGLRALVAELEDPTTYTDHIGANLDGAAGSVFEPLGVTDADLQGKYFHAKDYSIAVTGYDAANRRLTYTITVTAPGCVGGGNWTLDDAGTWEYQ